MLVAVRELNERALPRARSLRRIFQTVKKTSGLPARVVLLVDQELEVPVKVSPDPRQKGSG